MNHSGVSAIGPAQGIAVNRRGFLSACLAMAAAPAIVRADALMQIVPIHLPVVTRGEPEWVVDVVNPGLTEAELKRVVQEAWRIPQPEVIPVSPQVYARFQALCRGYGA